MKRSKRTLILTLLLLLMTGIAIHQHVTRIAIDDVKEREELLVASMWEIAESDLQKSEIDSIFALQSKAAIYPYYTDVAVDLKDGSRIYYQWLKPDKSVAGQSK